MLLSYSPAGTIIEEAYWFSIINLKCRTQISINTNVALIVLKPPTNFLDYVTIIKLST